MELSANEVDYIIITMWPKGQALQAEIPFPNFIQLYNMF